MIISEAVYIYILQCILVKCELYHESANIMQRIDFKLNTLFSAS